jgi:hypothetical protein
MNFTDPKYDILIKPPEGERNYVDPLSNTPILTIKEIEADPSGFLEGRLPRSGTLRFLHEFTHYWCYDSILGEVAYLLTDQSSFIAKNVWLNPARFSAKEQQYHATRVVRCHAALRLMQPITEGLANFSEFDLFPLYVDNCPPLEWATRCFVSQQLEGYELLRGCLEMLLGARLDQSAARRKFNVLAAPISKDPRGYLAGYLAVKQLWRVAASKFERFQSSDLFLRFCKQYFYDDWELADLLLEPSGSSVDSEIRSIASYLNGRIARFWRWNVQAELNRFLDPQPEKAAGPDEQGQVQYILQTMPWLSARAHRGRERLLKEYERALNRGEGLFPIIRASTRGFAPIASLNCNFRRLGETVQCYHRDKLLATYPLDPIVSEIEQVIPKERDRLRDWLDQFIVYDPTTGEEKPLFEDSQSHERQRIEKSAGWIELYISLGEGSSFLIPQSILFTHPIVLHGELPEKLSSDPTSSLLLIRQAREHLARAADSLGRTFAQRVLGEQAIIDVLREEIRRHLDSYLLPIGLSFFPASRYEHVKQSIDDSGLLGLFEQKVELLEAVCLLTLQGSFGRNRRDADESLHAQYGSRLDEVEKELYRLNHDPTAINVFPSKNVSKLLAPFAF